MRKPLVAALAGATIAGGAMVATATQAQPYDYPPPAYGAPYGHSPYYNQPYRQPYGSYRDPTPYGYPGYGARTPYGYPGYGAYGTPAGIGSALAVLGSVLGLDYAPGFYSGVPVDRYGPDPNGMIGPDGRRIKCKLRRSYDRHYGGTVVRRECWTR